MSKIILGYWNVRARAAAARMMLEYGGLEWEDRTYEFGKSPTYDQSSWLNEKFNLGLDFPNLPYLIDGDVKLTESWAICRYIGNKIGLPPATEREKFQCDMLQGVVETLTTGLLCNIFKPNFDEIKPKMRENQEGKLLQMEKFLESRRFVIGPKLSFVDFALFQTLDHHRLLFPNILDESPNLKSYLNLFEGDERIAAYMKSDKYYTFPIFAPMAKWGGQKDE